MTGRLHALLIGVDRYPPATDGTTQFESLEGAVRDVTRIESFLKTSWRVAPEHIETLIAPLAGGEPPARSPTYENMIAAFRRLRHRARPGEHVWIHFSGHGGRVATAWPRVKLGEQLDEALVPTDISSPRARYLRDLELASLLDELTDAGLLVTLVLDCCHSGDGIRKKLSGRSPRQRGGGRVDRGGSRRRDSLVAQAAELANTWARIRRRSLQRRSEAESEDDGSGWLFDRDSGVVGPRLGYVFLAACRAHEVALEDYYEGDVPGGALTHALLGTLRELCPTPERAREQTWEAVHRQVRIRLQEIAEGQTPQLEGELTRSVLGDDLLDRRAAVAVLAVDHDARQVLLDAGEAHAVFPGNRLALYRPEEVELADPAARLAVVEVAERGATKSWARLVWSGPEPIENSALAIAIRAGTRGRAVRLKTADSVPRATAERLRALLLDRASGSMEVLSEQDVESPADFDVVMDSAGYGLQLGGRPLPGVPPVPWSDERPQHKLRRRLLHLCRFYDILEHQRPASPLSGKLRLELLQTPSDSADFRPGDPISLRVLNASDRVLNVTVFDLRLASLRIDQIFPTDALARPIEPGDEEILKFKVSAIPAGLAESIDVVKAFATLDQTSFRWLEMPPIDAWDSIRGPSSVDAKAHWTADQIRFRTVR